jgi:hypothetical protein
LNTPNVGIPYVPEGTLDPAAALNISLNVIDALLQTAVLGLGVNTPPVSPSDGDMYIVGIGTGAWVGEDDNLARYVAEGTFWQFYTAGTQVNVVLNKDDSVLYVYNSSSASAGWQEAVAGGGGTTAAPVITETGTTRNALPANAGDYVRFTNAAAKTYTFDDATAFEIGQEFHGRNAGTADLEIVPTTAFTMNVPAGGSLFIPQGGTFTVKIVGVDEADLFGVTVPTS